MNKEYEETKVKSATSTFQEPIPNFDDDKYGGKTRKKIDQQSKGTEQAPSKPSGFLKSIPIIGGFLARTFTSEEIKIISNPIYDNMETYKKSQSDRSKEQDEAKITRTDVEHTKEIGSELEEVMLKESKKKNHGLTK